MSLFRSIVLYMAVALGANSVFADKAALDALREGDMKKLVVHSEPKVFSSTGFETADDGRGHLAEYKGKIVLLNFWATWCAPCRHEMPMLSDVQTGLGGDDFAVVTVATGRNPLPAMKTFFKEINVDNLPLHRDPKQKFAREMRVIGLPVTIILDREGREVARLQGDADWNSESARAIITQLINP